jgi:filamentous hemagglutinin
MREGRAFSGNAGASEFVQRTIVNLVQSKAAEGIKQLTDELGVAEGSPAHAALHAINACVGALAQNSNCGAAALGASSASVVAALIAEAQGGAEKLTQEQREARQALVTTLVTGVAAATAQEQSF